MLSHKGFKLAPVTALTALSIAWTVSMDPVYRDEAWRIICGAHCLHPNAIETMEDVRIGHTLRLLITVFLDGYVKISLHRS